VTNALLTLLRQIVLIFALVGVLSPAVADSIIVTPNGATSSTTLDVLLANVRRVTDFAGVCNGNVANAALDTAGFTAALAQLQSEGGGTLEAAGCVISGSVVFPNDGQTIPHQNPIRIEGIAGYSSGRTALPSGKSILYFINGSGTAKIDTRGLGELQIADITLQSLDPTGGIPFIQTTTTTLKINNVGFVGANAGTSANEDAIILGGTTTSGTINGSATSPFQGYGTVIQNSYFSQIKRAIVAQTYANGWVARDNEIWADSGNPSGAVIEINGGVISGVQQYDTGIVLEANLMELVHYAYGIRCIAGCELNSFIANNGYDNPGAAAVISIDLATSFSNLVIGGMMPGGSVPYFDNPAPNTYISIDPNNLPSVLGYLTIAKALTVAGAATFTGGTGKTIVQPATASVNTSIFSILRSMAETTNPGGHIFDFNNDGSQNWGNNPGSGNITNTLPTGASWFNNGRSWGFNGTTGGNMKQDSGTGGSYFDMHNYAVRNFDQNDNLQAKFSSSAGGSGIGWDFGPTGDVSLYRSAVGALTDSGAFTATGFTATGLVGIGSHPVCVTSVGILEVGSLSAGLVTCP
jgi:hypothetical protein